jgi:hypothetical protein
MIISPVHYALASYHQKQKVLFQKLNKNSNR